MASLFVGFEVPDQRILKDFCLLKFYHQLF